MRVRRWAGGFCVGMLVWLSAAALSAQEANRAQLVVQLGHSGAIGSVAFSPDGRLALTGSWDHTALLWEASTGELLRRFEGHTAEVNAVAFSPDGRIALTGSNDKTARLWDVATGKEIRRFTGNGKIKSASFSASGREVLTVDNEKSVQMWDTVTGRDLHRFDSHHEDVNCAALSPNGRLVAVGVYGGNPAGPWVELWDATTGKVLRKLTASFVVSGTRFSRDGKKLFTVDDGDGVHIWDAASGVEQRWIKGNVHVAAFTADGNHLVIASYDKVAQLWDLTTGKQVQTYNGHTKDVYGVAISPDGKEVLTGSLDETARLWDAATGKELHVLESRAGVLNSLDVSRDGKYLVTGSHDSKARVWDVATGKQIQIFQEPKGDVASVAISADDRFVLTGAGYGETDLGETARLWDVASGKEVRHFDHTASVSSVAFSADDRFVLTGSYDNIARLWNTATGVLVQTFTGHTQIIETVAISPDGRTVVTGGEDGSARLWDVATGKELRSFINERHAEVPLGNPGVNLMTGEVVPPYAGGPGVWSVKFSPDGRWVLTGNGDGVVKLWDSGTGKELRRFDAHKDDPYLGGDVGIKSVAFSPDGRKIVAGGNDQKTRIWDVASGQDLLDLPTGGSGAMDAVIFSADGKTVFTGGDDGMARMWNAQSGAELASVVGFSDGGWGVASTDGRFDSGDLDGGAPMHWVVDDNPMHALPLEIFMRDYYTPGLLARVMKGEKLPAIPTVAEIKNRVQPEVKVVSVVPSSKTTGRVDVTVHAASVSDEKGTKSGLQDLRLFRDGQMVADGYREGALKDGDFMFRDVMLKSDAKKVTFTAYAFNSERIKSATASYDYEVKTPLNTAVKRRAFLLQVGVNHTSASGCELKYSVNDAETMSSALSEKLRSQGFEVEAVKLESVAANEKAGPSASPQDDTMKRAQNDKFMGGASKESIHARLEEIAAKAKPDDVFFMSFSGHGYSAAGGAFYILPSSLQGDCSHVDDAMLKTAISADELADWLRPIDAGEMTLILDACYSAESVQAGDFKPGPMGSRGLGQVAYDKRMRVLAASQSDAVAHEYDYLHQGLLSYVLVKDGLEKDQADWKPKDGKITVGEWLSYAAAAVPDFKPANAPKVEETKSVCDARGSCVEGDKSSQGPKAVGQVPAIFDFSRTDTLVLAK